MLMQPLSTKKVLAIECVCCKELDETMKLIITDEIGMSSSLPKSRGDRCRNIYFYGIVAIVSI